MTKGFYIVIEGPQGVGKTTQVELLANTLQKNNYPVRVFREPDSQSHLSARAIRNITQNPDYPLNTRAEVLLYNAARALSLEVINKSVNQGVICLVDRNYLTTLAVQYYGRGDVPDYETIYNIISFAVGKNEPDLTIVMDAPADVLYRRQKVRAQGERFDNLDIAFLDKVRAGYLIEAKKRHYPVVLADNSTEVVRGYIWEFVQALITGKNVNTKAANIAEQSNNTIKSDELLPESKKDYVETLDNGHKIITDIGKQRLETVVTDTKADVYSFSGELDQVTLAAAMARLSRRGDDMRVTLLDEFVDKQGKDQELIKRVVTAYGDDSVQQLVGVQMVIEGASNLLTKQIEWGRLATYLEQSIRYIYYDQKDQNGNYKYYIPLNLGKDIKELYVSTMDKLFDNYSKVVHRVTEYISKNDTTPKNKRDGAWKAAVRAQACDAARVMLPVSTQSTVGIFASSQALESLIIRLGSLESKEAQDCSKNILLQARKVVPAFLERTDKPERGGATMAYLANTKKAVKELAHKYAPLQHSTNYDAVTLTDYYPKNELSVVPHMLYEHTSLSEQELNDITANLSYKEKTDIFMAYMGERLNRRHRPGRALERLWYSFDLVCDYGIFRDLQRHRMVNDLSWQQLTPRYGYDIPELIEKAGVSDILLDSFDISLELNSALVRAGKMVESQYATLMGHKMRWKITMNARQAFHFIELRTTPHGHPGYRKLVKQMYDKIATVHPLISESIKFVNKDEDPELTRLAAERATQYKLSMLDKK
jgi:dTMP kinase